MSGRTWTLTFAVLLAGFALGAEIPVASPASAAPSASDDTSPESVTYPLNSLVPGTIGIARTVFSGTEIDTFSVEIVSVVKNIGPGQDLILARALGARLEKTGVAQGMSGSPVFIGDKLVGAISSTWSFAKEPLLGITPFAQMVDEASTADRLRALPKNGDSPSRGASAGPGAASLARSPTRPAPIGAPVTFAGFDPRVVSLADSLFRPWGFTIVEGGHTAGVSGAASGKSQGAAQVEPGATLGVQLVGGDANMTAIGTVTWVDENRVYGWGHPFLSMGDVEMPLVGGTIHAIVPSQQISFKIGSGGEVFGTITGDHRSGIFGRLGPPPPMTSYDLTLRRGASSSDAGNAKTASTETYHFDLVRDRMLMPLLVGLVSSNAFLAYGGAIAEETVSFSQRLVLDDGRATNVKTFFSGDQNAPQISALLSEAARVLATNPFEEIHVDRIEAEIAFEPGVRLAAIETLAADADTLRPGQTLRGTYSLRDYQGDLHAHPFSFDIPGNAREGRYLLVAADATSAEEFEAERNPRAFAPRSLDELMQRIERLRLTNEVHLFLYRATQGVLIEGRPLPDLPVSTLSVMRSAARSGVEEDLPAELVAEKRVPAGRLVQGSHVIRLDVKKEKS